MAGAGAGEESEECNNCPNRETERETPEEERWI